MIWDEHFILPLFNHLFCWGGGGGGDEEAYAKLPHPCRYKSSNFKDCTKITFPKLDKRRRKTMCLLSIDKLHEKQAIPSLCPGKKNCSEFL
jgi:hypothetical protein